MTRFKVITEKPMGSLRPTHRRVLRRIEIQREKLVEQLEALDVEQEAIVKKTIEHLQIATDNGFKGLHFAEDGVVTAIFCPCAVCQADMNNVSVAQATEEMILQGVIHDHEAPLLRQRAKEVDSKRKTVVVH